MIRRLCVLLAGPLLLGCLGLPDAAALRTLRPVFSDRFRHANGHHLVTNEYAYRNPADRRSVRSRKWIATSGSLFVKEKMGWTGTPDGCKPDRYSRSCNDSAVFRLHTRRVDFGDVTVRVDLINRSLTQTARTPAKAYDGVHLWLRYQSEEELYAVSFNRRDGSIVIKKKCPGGPSNGGTYYSLGKPVTGKQIPFGKRQSVEAQIRNNTDGSVTIGLSRDGVPLTTVTDRGTGCDPIRRSGAVGIRGDNDDFRLRYFAVWRLQAG